MKGNESFQFLMVGLPRAGKTTFLAALWHVVRSDEVPGSLRLERLEGDQQYLNLIAQQWLQCVELERTPIGEINVDMQLRDPQTGRLALLRIPDMSGELYESLWESRACDTSFTKLVRSVDGFVLFVHPAKVSETSWIDDANLTYSDWVGPQDAEPQEESSTTDWEPRAAPTQVKIVELLQFLNELTGKRVRVALVTSAWDIVKDETSSEEWLKKRLPLVWQYLMSNRESFEVNFIGISAQGGEVTGVSSKAEILREHSVASRRIKVCESEVSSDDITLPVKWLMSKKPGVE